MSNDKRHTAIQCKHSVTHLRLRITTAVAECLGEYMELTPNLEMMITRLSGELNTIMWEHADEIASEYRSIIHDSIRDMRNISRKGDSND